MQKKKSVKWVTFNSYNNPMAYRCHCCLHSINELKHGEVKQLAWDHRVYQ